eukprot:gene16628-biopygen1648
MIWHGISRRRRPLFASCAPQTWGSLANDSWCRRVAGAPGRAEDGEAVAVRAAAAALLPQKVGAHYGASGLAVGRADSRAHGGGIRDQPLGAATPDAARRGGERGGRERRRCVLLEWGGVRRSTSNLLATVPA